MKDGRLFHLTKSKERMAKKRLTSYSAPRRVQNCWGNSMSHAASPSNSCRTAAHNGRASLTAKGHDIIDCFACGFRHVLPLPDPASLEQEYREKYYADEKPTFIAHAGEDQVWFELAQNDRLTIFERLVGAGRRRLLDIGCGPGFFLKTAIARGWDAYGIEPSRQAAAHARSWGPRSPKVFSMRRPRRALGPLRCRQPHQCAGACAGRGGDAEAGGGSAGSRAVCFA